MGTLNLVGNLRGKKITIDGINTKTELVKEVLKAPA
jgi:hypothetical protein